MIEIKEKIQDRIDFKHEIPAKAELKFLGKIRPQKGHTVFEVNMVKGTVVPAKFESIDANMKGRLIKRIVIDKECIYVPALNIKNAVKKVNRLIEKQQTNGNKKN